MTIHSCHTFPYREGYFMSAEDQEAAKKQIVWDYLKERERQVGLKNEANKLAAKLEGIVNLLREDPDRLEPDKETWLKEFEDYSRIVSDLRKTRDELYRLRRLAEDGGFSSLLLP